MKTRLFTIILTLILATGLKAQILLDENFSYAAGDSLQANGWTLHSGTTGPILVVSPSLTYTGYPLSNIGNAAQIDSGGYEDVNRTFSEQTSGNIYVSFLLKATTGRATGDYFLHIGQTTLGSTFRMKIFIKENDASSFFLGISKGNNVATATFTTTTFNYNTTYLVVGKYSFLSGTASDDLVSLFAFTAPNLPITEPTTPLLGPLTDATTDLTNAGTIALRQGSSGLRPSFIIDGIRIAKLWSNIVTGIVPVSTIAESFNLSQNYPNPFNPTTTINFSIPKTGFVTLKVYDINGREVKNLVSENMNAGKYEVDANFSELNSGVYFYKLNVSGDASFSDTKKLMLVK